MTSNLFMFDLDELTSPAVEPVSLVEARKQINIDDDMTEDDAFISGLIVSARDYCENDLSRAFVRRQFRLTMNGFPYSSAASRALFLGSETPINPSFGYVSLPRPPLSSVESVSYIDPSGATIVLGPSKYKVKTGGKFQGYVAPVYGTVFPSARLEMDSVTIDFTAGYSVDASLVPQGIKSAMSLLVAHWYKYREEITAGSVQRIPMGIDALLSPYRWGFYA